jgi:hypothetical protein
VYCVYALIAAPGRGTVTVMSLAVNRSTDMGRLASRRSRQGSVRRQSSSVARAPGSAGPARRHDGRTAAARRRMGGSGDEQRSSALIADEMTRAGWMKARNVLDRAAAIARLLRLDALLASKNNEPLPSKVDASTGGSFVIHGHARALSFSAARVLAEILCATCIPPHAHRCRLPAPITYSRPVHPQLLGSHRHAAAVDVGLLSPPRLAVE